MQMKKKVLSSIIIVTFLLGGCSQSSDEVLSFQELELADYNQGSNLAVGVNDFFATDLTVISQEENQGDDPLLDSAAILLLNKTKQIPLYSDNIYDKLYPASLTKLMTALVALRYGELTDSVTISYNASHLPYTGVKLCGLQEGDVISLDTLLHGLLIYSGNDAGIAIAEHISGSEEAFVKLMNEEARRLGAVHSNFINSHGLHDDNHYSTAYDIYLIINELMKYDHFLTIIGKRDYNASYTDKHGYIKEKSYTTSNLYLKGNMEHPEGINILGGMTGSTSKAGSCSFLLVKTHDGNEYIMVILKATNGDELYSQMHHLFTYIVTD